MATYVISDIHGQYKMFLDLLDKIKLKDTDTLYILGDILDRGPHPIKALIKIMEMPNAICIAGNPEYMALQCLPFLMEEITEMSIDQLNEKMLNIRSQNGGRQNAHRRIFCTRDGNFAVQGLAARNNKFLQFYDLLVKGPVAAGLLRFVKAFLRWLPRGHSKQCRAVTAILLYTTFTKKQSPVW